MAQRKTVYVGASLTEAPPAFRDLVNTRLKGAIRQIPGVQVMDFVGLERGNEVSVYVHDKQCTMGADLCVFVCDYPSTGLGIEIECRLMAGKPMLCMAHADRLVTRMLLGLCEVEGIPFRRYKGILEIVPTIQEMLAQLKPN